MKKENKINIIIKGCCGSGKSRILYLIKNTLRKEGFEVDHELNEDFDNEKDFNEIMESNYQNCLNTIKSRTTITIKEKNKIHDLTKDLNEE
jgi:uridine kinase